MRVQVLINSYTCTSLEYHVVDAVHRNAAVSVGYEEEETRRCELWAQSADGGMNGP